MHVFVGLLFQNDPTRIRLPFAAIIPFALFTSRLNAKPLDSIRALLVVDVTQLRFSPLSPRSADSLALLSKTMVPKIGGLMEHGLTTKSALLALRCLVPMRKNTAKRRFPAARIP